MFSRMGITSAFSVPEWCSEAKGGEGEAGEGTILAQGRRAHTGFGIHKGGYWGRRRAPFDTLSVKQQLTIPPLLITSLQQAQQLRFWGCKAEPGRQGSRA